MKAIVFTHYGSPDVLQLNEIKKPTPQENQVLIKVVAAGTNALDWHEMRGEPLLMRLGSGLRKPNDTRLGVDIAGYVEAVGAGVTQFKVGDEVYGVAQGAFAEYACANAAKIVHKPASLSFEEAASIPVAAVTALQGLREYGQLQTGQKILINGATGGVGTFSVQIAKALGAEVTAVCSSAKVEMVRHLGADHIIDYKKQDVRKIGQQFDLILDNVGNFALSDYKRNLTAHGTAVIIGMTTLVNTFSVLIGAKIGRAGKRNIMTMLANVTADELTAINEFVEAGKLKPIVEKTYELDKTADAIRYLETGHARGKVVITVAASS